MTFLHRGQGMASRWKPEGRKPLLDNKTRLPRDYELMVILLPDMAEEDNQAALQRVRTYITDVNAEITNTQVDSPWGRRRLAYAIRHEGVDYRDGFYSVIHFSAAPTGISDIERELKLDTNVIRYLLVMHDPKAGEKITETPEGTEAAASEEVSAAEAAPAEEAPVEVAAPVAEAAAEEAPAAAPATETAPVEDAAPATDETEAAVEEVADAIEGEEEPAPADGPEADEKEA